MKTFIQFECIFPLQSIEMNNKIYSINELYLLNGYSLPIHRQFNKEKPFVTNGHLFWSEKTNRLYFQMWIKAEEVSYFEREILNGKLVPMNIRFTPNNIDDNIIKNTSSDQIQRMINKYTKENK